MATKITDLSNADAKDGLLKDVYLDSKRPKKAKKLKKQIFGPYQDEKAKQTD